MTGRPIPSVRQPRGLWVLAATEMGERISFHSILALLTLYLAGDLLLPMRIPGIAGLATLRAAIEGVTGPLSVQALAAQIFGLYISLIYLGPLLGGILGDRWVARRTAVLAGAAIMTIGHLALAFDTTFLVGLILLIVGTGLLRGNLSVQVKQLYAEGDAREANGFQIFYMAICIGAFVAPLIGGALAAYRGWHIALVFAGGGTLLAFVIYLAGQAYIPPDRPPAAGYRDVVMPSATRRKTAGLFAIWPFVILFWIAQTQVWNVYNLWARDHVDLTIGTFTVPIPWLQALDGLAPALLSPCIILWWQWRARMGREPDLLGKLAIGCAIFALAMALLALGPLFADSGGRVPLALPIAFHLLSNLGTVCVVPAALALFASKAPESARGLFIGVNSLSVFIAGLISGRLGGLYDVLSPPSFWLLHAGIAGTAAAGFALSKRISSAL